MKHLDESSGQLSGVIHIPPLLRRRPAVKMAGCQVFLFTKHQLQATADLHIDDSILIASHSAKEEVRSDDGGDGGRGGEEGEVARIGQRA